MKLEELINQVIQEPEVLKELLHPNSRELSEYQVKLEEAAKSGNTEKTKKLCDLKPKELRFKRVNIILDIFPDSIQLSKIVPVRENTGRKIKKDLVPPENNDILEEVQINEG